MGRGGDLSCYLDCSDTDLANPSNGNCHPVISLISQEGGLTTTIVRAPVLKDDPEYK